MPGAGFRAVADAVAARSVRGGEMAAARPAWSCRPRSRKPREAASGTARAGPSAGPGSRSPMTSVRSLTRRNVGLW